VVRVHSFIVIEEAEEEVEWEVEEEVEEVDLVVIEAKLRLLLMILI